jgi:multidrug efflux system membrane fusion protein
MGRRALLPVLLVLALGLGAYLYYVKLDGIASAKPIGPGRPVPVLAAEAVRKTLPLTLPAVGQTQAAATVTVRSRVDGHLLEAAFREGQPVRQGDPLFRIDPRPLEASLNQAEANLGRDQAQLDKARLQLTRNQGLAPKGYVSTESLEDARASAQALEASVKADQAAVDLARLQLGYATIASPIDGLAGARLADPGNLVKTNDTALVTINQVEPIYLAFALPERHLAEVRRLMGKGGLRVQARPQDGGPPVLGEVGFVDNKVDATTGTIGLRATFSNQDRRLLPGQFVTLDLALGELTDVLVVPSRAVQAGQKGDHLYVVGSDGNVERRVVALGPRVGDETAILSGLAAGDRVVIDGQLRLTHGAKVEVKDQAAGGQ